MSKTIQFQKLEHSPTLNTILMVEHVLKNMEGSLMTVADLKRKLPKQINHNLLITILEYLEQSSKILVSIRGITWIHNENTNLRNAIKSGRKF
jgi:hypothetical protein